MACPQTEGGAPPSFRLGVRLPPSSAPAVDKSGDGFDDVSFRLNAFAVSSADVYSSTANCEVHVQASGASSTSIIRRSHGNATATNSSTRDRP